MNEQNQLARKLSEEELLFLAAIVESSDDAIIGKTLQGIITSWNQGAEIIYGYTAKEIVGKPISILVPKENPDEIPHILEKLKKGQQISHYDTIRVKKNGQKIDVSLTISPVKDKSGNIIGASTIARDITQKIRDGKEFKERGARLQAILDYAVEGIITINEKGIMESANIASESIFGYSSSELMGRNVSMLMPSPYHEQHDSYLSNYMHTGNKKIIGIGREVTGRRKDGTTFPMDLAVSEVKLEDRVIFTGFVRDITERKRAEEELVKTLENLKRSNAELEQFAYVASHDLQEPLRMVSNYMNLIERRYKDKLDKDAEEFIGFAVDGAKRMQTLINDLLSFSRVGSRGKPFEPTPLETILSEALSNLQITIEDTKAEITHDPLPTIMGDKVQMVQLFQNLISNAIKFKNNENNPRVHISAKQKEKEWIISVKDNGIGIDPQYAERIFIIFQRLHNREDYPGTGIGLAVCRKIVERHGGKIWVESEKGKGATFYFTIPA
jgi:PAS domain S-box-containing protein